MNDTPSQMCNIIIYAMAWAFRLYVAFFVLYDFREGEWREIDPYAEDYLSLFQTACRLIRHATCLEAMNALLNWAKFCTYLSVSKFVFEAPYLNPIGIVRADSLTGAHLYTRS